MSQKPLIVIDPTRLTEQQARLVRGTDAPALATICAVTVFSFAIVISSLGATCLNAGI